MRDTKPARFYRHRVAQGVTGRAAGRCIAVILLEIAIPRAPAGSRASTRRRVSTGVGCYPDPLDRVEAELSSAGTDYVLAADVPPPDPPLLAIAEALLAASGTPLTHQELLARWPVPAPHPDSLHRTLAAAVRAGRFTATGTGTRSEPHCFSLNQAPA